MNERPFPDSLGLDARHTRIVRALMGTGTLTLGTIGLLCTASGDYSGWRDDLMLVVSVSTLPVALRWFFGRWPGRRLLIGFIVYADVSITIALLCKDTHLTSIDGTVLYAVVTTLVVIAVPFRICFFHTVTAAMVLGLLAWRVTHSGAADSRVVGAHSLTMLLMFLSPLVLMVYVSELRSRAEESLVDPLTGLHNRRGLFAALVARTVTTPHAEPMSMCAVAADVDGMKGANDIFGHHIGDAVLVDVANILRRSAGNHWIVARLGGDEFACLALGKREEVTILEDELLSNLTGVRTRSGLTVSVGSASARLIEGTHVRQSATVLLREADIQMYRAKRTRRDTRGDRSIE